METRKIRRLSTFVSFIDFRKAYDRIPRGLLLQKLQAIGIKGAMYHVFEAIYKETKCCVQINGKHTSWFPSECGLKQGCLLSTTLFNLYINDLVDTVKSLEVGVSVNERIVPILLYVIHFRPPSVARSSFKFTCGQSVINTVSSYKYLGLRLNEYVDYSESITLVVQSPVEHLAQLFQSSDQKEGCLLLCIPSCMIPLYGRF